MPPAVQVEERSGRVGWALVAANGRVLARSVAAYRSAAELAAAFRELLADRRSLRITLGRDEGARTWSWTAQLPARSTAEAIGRAVARSGRGYLRHDQCRKGAAGFVEALAALPPGSVPGAVPGRVPGRAAGRAGPPEGRDGAAVALR
jgi:hypothetical protein